MPIHYWIWRQGARIVMSLKAVIFSRRTTAIFLLAALTAGSAYYAKTFLSDISMPQWQSIPQNIEIVKNIDIAKKIENVKNFDIAKKIEIVKNIELPRMEDWLPTEIPHIKKRWNPFQKKWEPNTIREIEAEMDRLQKTIHELESSDSKLLKRITQAERRMESISGDLATVKRYVTEGKWIEQMLAVIGNEVPKYVAITRDPATGEIRIPASFWDQAKDIFATMDYVHDSIDKVLNEDFEPKASGGWAQFLEENEQALKDLVGTQIEKVTSTVFLKLVATEMDAIWSSLKQRVVDHLEEEGYLKTSSETWTSRGPTLLPINSKKLSELEYQLILSVFEQAIERRSAAVVAKPDFALSGAGGEIIPHLTFPDFKVQAEPRLLGRLGLMYLFPANIHVEERAVKVIQPEVHPGACWAMRGSHGQIGIRLARPIIVTEVTIEHGDPRTTLHHGTAPREMEVWGLTSSRREKHRKVKEGDAPEQGASLLTSIEYKYVESQGRRPKLVQTFPIPLAKQNGPSTGVVVRINSNWGHPDFTCIYRIRVHGYDPLPVS
ncbi:MAG: UNC-like C-terminal-domain-containing protein [Benniella sp.]|nr:MAG: UNC-like C-terminal-domain-containing protein [Benniella sp.]